MSHRNIFAFSRNWLITGLVVGAAVDGLIVLAIANSAHGGEAGIHVLLRTALTQITTSSILRHLPVLYARRCRGRPWTIWSTWSVSMTPVR
jgi:hypothetical protein